MHVADMDETDVSYVDDDHSNLASVFGPRGLPASGGFANRWPMRLLVATLSPQVTSYRLPVWVQAWFKP